VGVSKVFLVVFSHLSQQLSSIGEGFLTNQEKMQIVVRKALWTRQWRSTLQSKLLKHSWSNLTHSDSTCAECVQIAKSSSVSTKIGDVLKRKVQKRSGVYQESQGVNTDFTVTRGSTGKDRQRQMLLTQTNFAALVRKSTLKRKSIKLKVRCDTEAQSAGVWLSLCKAGPPIYKVILLSYHYWLVGRLKTVKKTVGRFPGIGSNFDAECNATKRPVDMHLKLRNARK